MAPTPFAFLTGSGDERNRSVLGDLRSGRAGAGLRGGLSLATLAMWLAPAFFVLGFLDVSSGWIRDHHVGWTMAMVGLAWGGTLVALWWSYRRFRPLIRTSVILLCVWTVAIPTAFGVDEAFRNAEFLIAGVILTAVAISVGTIACGAYLAMSGQRITNRLDEVIVYCPECRYSMVGLESTTCPECGARFTIDGIIRAQGYGPEPRAIDAVPATPSPRLRLESTATQEAD
ncbi:MAG: hypothetical protein HKO59_16800 [Phycisphaerales bacterium]|nr:hypothetical protein [Phycisphaerales bacterium]